MMKTKIYIIATLVSIALLTACEKSDLRDNTKPAEGARICFINLSADVTTTGSIKTNELNLYFNQIRVTTQRSLTVNRLRGIPYRSSYPGSVTAVPTATTAPTSNPGTEYFIAEPGVTNIVAKDTALNTGQTTLFTTDFTFIKDKYYSIFATGLMPAMSPIIVEDDIVSFQTLGKTRVRCVNAVYGVTGDSLDIWLIHQAATTELGKAPYKLAVNLDFNGLTSFTDTISSGSYKFIATKAGTIPSSITSPTPDPLTGSLLGKSYTMAFPAGTIVVPLSSATSFSQRFTYSLLLYGQFGKTGIIAPYGSLFRNRLM